MQAFSTRLVPLPAPQPIGRVRLGSRMQWLPIAKAGIPWRCRGMLAVVALMVAASPQDGRAQATLTPERIAALDARLPALLQNYHLAALGVGIIRNGQLVWIRVYGEQGPGAAATPQTLFNVASMTKPITAEPILR